MLNLSGQKVLMVGPNELTHSRVLTRVPEMPSQAKPSLLASARTRESESEFSNSPVSTHSMAFPKKTCIWPPPPLPHVPSPAPVSLPPAATPVRTAEPTTSKPISLHATRHTPPAPTNQQPSATPPVIYIPVAVWLRTYFGVHTHTHLTPLRARPTQSPSSLTH